MFKVEVNINYDAFGEDHYTKVKELERILNKIISELDLGFVTKAPIMDINGNKVGFWEITED